MRKLAPRGRTNERCLSPFQERINMTNEEQVVSALEDRLRSNLDVVEYDGPARVFGQEVVGVLIEMILSVLDGCFGASGSTSAAGLAMQKRLNVFQRVKLKQEIIKQVYLGSRRHYNQDSGDRILEAVVKTAEESSEGEQAALLDYVETNAREFTPTDFGTL